MSQFSYHYTISGDFPDGFNINVLTDSIKSNEIITAEFLYILKSGNNVNIYFQTELSPAEQTELDVIIQNHGQAIQDYNTDLENKENATSLVKNEEGKYDFEIQNTVIVDEIVPRQDDKVFIPDIKTSYTESLNSDLQLLDQGVQDLEQKTQNITFDTNTTTFGQNVDIDGNLTLGTIPNVETSITNLETKTQDITFDTDTTTFGQNVDVDGTLTLGNISNVENDISALNAKTAHITVNGTVTELDDPLRVVDPGNTGYITMYYDNIDVGSGTGGFQLSNKESIGDISTYGGWLWSRGGSGYLRIGGDQPGATGQVLVGDSTLQNGTLTVNGDAIVNGNLELENIPDVEQSITDLEQKTQYIAVENGETIVNSNINNFSTFISDNLFTIADQLEVVEIPENATHVKCRAWGAGGQGDASSSGGGGGFSETIYKIEPGQTHLYCYVGSSGYNASALVAGGGDSNSGIEGGGGGTVIAVYDGNNYTLVAVGGGGGASFTSQDIIGGYGGGEIGGGPFGGGGGIGGIHVFSSGGNMSLTVSNFEDFDGEGGGGDFEYIGGGGGYGGGAGGINVGGNIIAGSGGGGYGTLTVSGTGGTGAGKTELSEDGLSTTIGDSNNDGAITLKFYEYHTISTSNISIDNHSDIDQELTTIQDDIQNLEQKTQDITFDTDTTTFGQNVNILGNLELGNIPDVEQNIADVEQNIADVEQKTQYITVENGNTVIRNDTLMTFTTANQLQIVDIPEGTTQVKCRTWGAGGTLENAGAGGFSETVLNIEPGQTKLYCYVGLSGNDENTLVAGGGSGAGGGSVIAVLNENTNSYKLVSVAGGGGNGGNDESGQTPYHGGNGGGIKGKDGGPISIALGIGGSVGIGGVSGGNNMNLYANNFEDFNGKGGDAVSGDGRGGGGGGYGGGGISNSFGLNGGGGGGGYGDITISSDIQGVGAGKAELEEDGLSSTVGDQGQNGAISLRFSSDKLITSDIETLKFSSVNSAISSLMPGVGSAKSYYLNEMFNPSNSSSSPVLRTKYIDFWVEYGTGPGGNLRLHYQLNKAFTDWWTINYDSGTMPAITDTDWLIEDGVYHPHDNGSNNRTYIGSQRFNFSTDSSGSGPNSGGIWSSMAPFVARDITAAIGPNGENHFYCGPTTDLRWCQARFVIALNVMEIENRAPENAFDYYTLEVDTITGRSPNITPPENRTHVIMNCKVQTIV